MKFGKTKIASVLTFLLALLLLDFNFGRGGLHRVFVCVLRGQFQIVALLVHAAVVSDFDVLHLEPPALVEVVVAHGVARDFRWLLLRNQLTKLLQYRDIERLLDLFHLLRADFASIAQLLECAGQSLAQNGMPIVLGNILPVNHLKLDYNLICLYMRKSTPFILRANFTYFMHSTAQATRTAPKPHAHVLNEGVEAC